MLGRVSTATLQRADMPILLIRPVSVDRMIGSRWPLLGSAAARVARRPIAAGPLVTTTTALDRYVDAALTSCDIAGTIAAHHERGSRGASPAR